jgi:hypothetical protein
MYIYFINYIYFYWYNIAAFSSISSVSSSLSSPALSPRNVSPIDPTSVACSEVNANLGELTDINCKINLKMDQMCSLAISF